MEFLHTLTLALIQGVTEFLPISSSAHLLLPHHILGWPDQGLAFDTAVHLGSLVAVIAYFRTDILKLSRASLIAAKDRRHCPESVFAVNLLVASLPVLVVGFSARYWIELNLRGLEVIIAATMVFALVLLFADVFGKRQRHETDLGVGGALLIGLSQCLALIPGASRSGVTMTMALLLGFSRQAASRISFLIAIPAIAGASLLKLIDLFMSSAPVDWFAMVLGSVVACMSAFLCIKLFLNLIDSIGFLPFILYRLALGAILLLTIVY